MADPTHQSKVLVCYKLQCDSTTHFSFYTNTITQKEAQLVEHWSGDTNLRGPPGNCACCIVLLCCCGEGLWSIPAFELLLCKFESGCLWMKPAQLSGDISSFFYFLFFYFILHFVGFFLSKIAWWWVWVWSKCIVIIITLITHVSSSLHDDCVVTILISTFASSSSFTQNITRWLSAFLSVLPLSLQCLSGGIVSLSSVSCVCVYSHTAVAQVVLQEKPCTTWFEKQTNKYCTNKMTWLILCATLYVLV